MAPILNYSVFLSRTLQRLGFDLVAQYNCFEPPYDHQTGWPLKLPDPEFGPTTLVLLNFQDYVTPTDNGLLELQAVERHYRDRANQVVVTHMPHGLDRYYQGQVNLIEFNSHIYSVLMHVVALQAEWIDQVDMPAQHRWLSLNGRRTPHRRCVSEILKTWPNGLLSFGDEIPLPHWPYSTFFGTELHDNFLRLLPVYRGKMVNIVTETQFDRQPGIISEKTIFAMLAKQIPLVIGHRGIVEECRALGFDMFEDLVDIRYDVEPNETRIATALHSNKDLILGRIDLDPYARRLQAQQRFVLEHYVRLLQTRFMIAAERLALDLLGG